jgi:hypothetical protein
MIRYGELIQNLRNYTHKDISNEISDEHYRMAIKLAIRKNRLNQQLDQQWDLQHITAVLLHIAFNDGLLHPSQLNSDGLLALDWAERLIEKDKALVDWPGTEKEQLTSS